MLPKRKGEWAEVCFLARALALGFHVAKPYGDSAPYDFVVDPGHGRLLRIQVKCATTRGSRDGYQFRLTHGYDQRRYSAHDIDFVAAFVAPLNAWYLIPGSALNGRSVILLRPGRRNQRFAHFREAWRLLTAPGFRACISVLPRPETGINFCDK
jgi:hypothetical protein